MTAPTRRLANRLGNPVMGDEFWPRPDVVDPLCRDLLEGRGSRRLFALRRIGKTSVLLEVERRLRADPTVTVIRIDVQAISRFRDFLDAVFKQIPTEARLTQARQKFASNKVINLVLPALVARLAGSAAAPAATGFQNEFEHKAAWAGDIEDALREAGPIILIIDELPYMLRNMMRDGYKPWDVERFLATIRSWRINSDVRMLLSGSIGLAQLERNDGVQVADHIGDVFPLKLPPLPRAEAIEMVDALARGAASMDWTPALSAALVDASAETWPIFLQYGFEAVERLKIRDPAVVAAALEGSVRHSLDETFYKQFATRLSRYAKDEKAARVVLKTVAAAGTDPVGFQAIDDALANAGFAERRDDLLEALREDDFVVFDTGTQSVQTASRLVPVWVRARAWGR